MTPTKLVVIAGPTACGKTELVSRIAPLFRGEVVSADSRKLYRFMEIGTARPPKQIQKNLKFHLVDTADPDTPFTAADFKVMAEEAIHSIQERGNLPFLMGGSGLYIRAVIDGLFPSPPPSIKIRQNLSREALEFGNDYLYQKLLEVDPQAASRIEPNNTRRLIRALEVYYQTGSPISQLQRLHATHQNYHPVMIALERDRAQLYERINLRVERMVEQGLIEEVRSLLERGYSPDLPSMEGLGYRQIIKYLAGEYDLDEAIRITKRDTRRFAKRQFTWFKKDARYKWFHPEQSDKIIDYIQTSLNR